MTSGDDTPRTCVLVYVSARRYCQDDATRAAITGTTAGLI
jgi:hypothetical protein